MNRKSLRQSPRKKSVIWICQVCTFNNTAAVAGEEGKCAVCHSPFAEKAPVVETEVSSENWTCKACTYQNNSKKSTCEMCGAKKAASSPTLSGSSGQNPAKINSTSVNTKPNKVTDLCLDTTFLRVLQKSSESMDISPFIFKSVQNIVRTPWEQCENSGLKNEWADAAKQALLNLALEKVQKSCSLICNIVSLSIEDDQAIKTMLCVICNKNGNETELHINSGCSKPHPYCSVCLRKLVRDNIEEKKSSNGIKCQMEMCGSELDVHLIRRVLSSNEFDSYLNASLMAFIQNDKKLSRCPHPNCGAVVEIVQNPNLKAPKIIKERDEQGKVLSPEAWVHYQQYRIRCRGCDKSYCSDCRKSPYHTGFTCSSFVAYGQAKHCRFCAIQLTNSNTMLNPIGKALENICSSQECTQRAGQICITILDCGHPCQGCRDETKHPPCIESSCAAKSQSKQTLDDLCNICFIEGLNSAPVLHLECGHYFHRHCVIQKIEKKWPGVRITFGFLNCPLCKKEISHPTLEKMKGPIREMYDDISKKALIRLKVDGMLNDDKLKDPKSRYFNNPLQYALDSFAYYTCFKCKKVYFGGRRDCEQNNMADERPSEEFICFDCADLKSVHCKIKEHQEYHVWKCRFCCDIAVWFCFGTTHFCEACHSNNPMERTRRPRSGFAQCKGRETCKLKVDHSPNGAEPECEFSLGCGMCTDQLRKKEAEMKKEEEITKQAKGLPNTNVSLSELISVHAPPSLLSSRNRLSKFKKT